MAGGFTCFTSRKDFLIRASSVAGRAALEHLADKGAAGLERIFRHLQRDLDQRRGAHMIGVAMAGGGRGHVGQHQIGGTAQRLFQHRGRVRHR